MYVCLPKVWGMQEDTEKKDTQYILVHNSGKIPKKTLLETICFQISWFLFHIFHILFAAICVSQVQNQTHSFRSVSISWRWKVNNLKVNQSIGSLPGFLVAILFDLIISGLVLVVIFPPRNSNVLGQILLWIIRFHPDNKDI